MGKTRTIPLGLLALGALAVGGCAQSKPVVSSTRNQGSSWELVLPTRMVADARNQMPLDQLGEYTRRDDALGVHVARTPTALDSWGQEQPSLSDPRYIYIPRNENRFLFFVKPEARGRRSWR